MDIVDAMRGTLDYYAWCDLVIVRKWPRAPERTRSESVQATGALFAYANKAASTLSAETIATYEELASGTGFSWKDFLIRNYLSGTEKLSAYEG